MWVKLRRSQHEQKSSGLRLKADIARCGRHVSKVPIGDINLGDDPSKGVWHCRLIRRTVRGGFGLRAMVQERPVRVERRLSALLMWFFHPGIVETQ